MLIAAGSVTWIGAANLAQQEPGKIVEIDPGQRVVLVDDVELGVIVVETSCDRMPSVDPLQTAGLLEVVLEDPGIREIVDRPNRERVRAVCVVVRIADVDRREET